MSQRYQLSCSCGKVHVVGLGQAGQSLACACGANIAVPLLRDMKKLPAAVDERAAAQVAPGGGRSLPQFLAVLATIISLCAAAFFGFGLTRIDPSWTEDAQRVVDNSIIDQMTADEAIGAWRLMVLEGLGEKQPDAQMLNRDTYRMLKRLLRYSLVSSAVFGLTAVGLSFARRRSA